MKILGKHAKAVPAIAPADVGSGAAWTPVEVNATGYDRVCYILQLEDVTAPSGINAIQVEEATATGGTFAAISGTATSYGSTAVDGKVVVVDVPVTYNKPFQKLCGTAGTAAASEAVITAGVAILYRGTRQEPVAQTVTPVLI